MVSDEPDPCRRHFQGYPYLLPGRGRHYARRFPDWKRYLPFRCQEAELPYPGHHPHGEPVENLPSDLEGTREFRLILNTYEDMKKQNLQFEQMKRETAYSIRQDCLNSLLTGSSEIRWTKCCWMYRKM